MAGCARRSRCHSTSCTLAPTLSYEQLALVEMLGIGAHAVSRAAIEPGEWVLVVGAGPIGLSTLVFAKDAGARVIATDLDAGRLAFCRRELGIEHTIQAGPGCWRNCGR